MFSYYCTFVAKLQLTVTMKQPTNLDKDHIKVLPAVNYKKVLGEKLQDITQEDSDDSFYICNIGDVVQKHLNWLQSFPRIKPFYAIKCNPDETLLKSLFAMGTGFDCASKSEIRQMLGLGVNPKDIIFANPCKQKSHIRYARDNNVSLIVFDNEDELKKIKEVYPNAELVLRIQTDDSAATCQLSMKYGAPLSSCRTLLSSAQHMGLNVVGISFHVGSGCSNAGAYVEAIQNSRDLFDYASDIGYHLNLLDIGGGFPGTNNVDLSFEAIAIAVNKEIEKSFPAKCFGHLKIIAEPGRYYAASAFTLVTNIIARKTAHNVGHCNMEEDTKSLNEGIMYYVNDGLYGSFNCIFYDHAHPQPSLMLVSDSSIVGSKCYPSSIWGPTCDGLDKINDCVFLPRLNIGDWLVWENMGAYTLAAGSPFNGFKTRNVNYFISESDLSLLKRNVQLSILVSVGLIFKGQDYDFAAEIQLEQKSCIGKTGTDNLAFFRKCVESTIGSAEDINKSGFSIAASV